MKGIKEDAHQIKHIPADIMHTILKGTDLRLNDEYTWLKQGTKGMFGSWPDPGNILSNNVTERISVFVKPGKTPMRSDEMKAANELSMAEPRDLQQPVWLTKPADKKSEGGHPAPFPEALPARLIRMLRGRSTAGPFH